MTGNEIKTMQTQYVLQSWSKQRGLNPLPIEKVDGIYMFDFDGKRYADMTSQLVNLNVGHGNRAIIDAIKEQAGKYCYLSPAYASEPRAKLGKMIIERMSGQNAEYPRCVHPHKIVVLCVQKSSKAKQHLRPT